jgi:hypothetical protein
MGKLTRKNVQTIVEKYKEGKEIDLYFSSEM